MMPIITLCHTFFIISFVLTVTGEILIELNHDFDNEKTLNWPGPGYRKFLHTPIVNGFNEKGLWYAAFNYEGAEHAGTHMDSPSHFYEDGWTVDQIPIKSFFAPAVVIDIREKVRKDPLASLSAHDVVSWVDEHGSLPNNSVVLVLTGWESRYNDSKAYFNIQGDTKVFPGIGISAAQTLLGYRTLADIYIVGVGIDGPSIDVGNSKDAETHRELFAANVYGLENLKNLDKLPTTGAQLVVMPMKIKGGSGAPCRVIARISENGSNAFLGQLTTIVASLAFLLRVS